MSRLVRYYPQQMLMMAQPAASSDDARLLYKQALAQPGSQTALQMLVDLHIAVNGPWQSSHPQLVTAVDLESSDLLVLKLLPPSSQQQKQAAKAEQSAISTLQLGNLNPDSALVKCSLVTIPVSIEHAAVMEVDEG